MISMQTHFENRCGPPAVVIQEHFETLIKYGKMVERITEFGIQTGASTCCWLMSKPKSYTGYDIDLDTLTLRSMYEAYAKENGTDFRLICQSSIQEHIEETDLLFIDSDHRPEHVTEELRMQNDMVKRFIILHDTECRVCPGLREVVDKFVAGSPDWKMCEHFSNNNGLTVLERIGSNHKKGSMNMETEETIETPKEQRVHGGIVIHSAAYGILSGRSADVVAKVKDLIAGGAVSVVASNGNFGDPAPGLVKELRVKYSVDGVDHDETVAENETITFAPAEPVDPEGDTPAPPTLILPADLAGVGYADLQAKCKDAGLPGNGLKEDLIARLTEAAEAEAQNEAYQAEIEAEESDQE